MGDIISLERNLWFVFAFKNRYTLPHRVLGDVVFVKIIGRPMVILNSFEAATSLLGERSAIYSDRPRFPIVDL